MRSLKFRTRVAACAFQFGLTPHKSISERGRDELKHDVPTGSGSGELNYS